MQKIAISTIAALALAFVACHGEKPPETTGGDNNNASSSSSSGTPSDTSSSSSGGTSSSSGGAPTEPVTCGGKACAAGESCVSYYGIAGPRGPQFHECAIPCRRGTPPNDGCPDGKKCVTVADGPGDVCR